MTMLKQRSLTAITALLIICTLIKRSYQQTTATTKTDLTFCIKNHTMSHTLQSFWHDANADCELESKRLIDLYSQLLDRSIVSQDQCTVLLKHQLRKKLIQLISVQLEESFVLQTVNSNRELKQDLQQLQLIDEKVAQIIWERAINEVYLFMQPEEIINEIVLLKEQELQIVAFQSLFNKYVFLNVHQSETLIPLLTYQLTSLFNSKSASVPLAKRLESLYNRLPKELRFLFEASKEEIGLLNYHHFEYLYAPRDNGPDAARRLPLTWIQNKNSTDSDGHLLVSFNDKGLVAFGSRFGTSPKYLYVDEDDRAAYFWIGSGIKASQWWQVLWPHDSLSVASTGYIMLQNEATKDLFCAGMEYDENRRYVTLLNVKGNLENPACFWLITRF